MLAHQVSCMAYDNEHAHRSRGEDDLHSADLNYAHIVHITVAHTFSHAGPHSRGCGYAVFQDAVGS